MNEVIEHRLQELEIWRRSVDAAIIKTDLTGNYINERFNRVEEELKGLKTTARNLNYTVWAVVIGYALKFAFSGALAPITG